jgi:glycosyltransferase involved in cell wall biosynthesis
VKVAQLATRYPPGPGGVERHVAEIAPRLFALGHRVEVFTSDLYREFPWERLPDAVPRQETTAFGAVHRLPVLSLPGELHYTWFRGLGRALDRFAPDVVHAHTYGTHQVAVAARRRRRVGTPFVLTAHFHPVWSIEGGGARRRLRNFYDRRLAGPLVRRASRLIVQTQEEERLVRALGLELPPVTVVPPGYTPVAAPSPDGRPFSEQLGLPGPFFLFVGRLASNKGLLRLAEAFAPIARRDRSASLVVIGADGGVGPALDARLGELGIADRVRRLGHLADDRDLAQAYREARATVLPSDYEAFGLVLLESLAQGTPVVASRVGGIPEIIEDGRSGLLVPPGDVPALGEALERLWSDPALARALGESGRREVVPRFTWEGLVDRLDAVYREVAGA